MKVGKSVRRYVEPMGYTWLRQVESFDSIPVWVTYFGEDDEMKYYVTDYAEGHMWGVLKEVEECR